MIFSCALNHILYGKITLKDSEKPIVWKIWLLYLNFYYIFITNNETNFLILSLKNLFLVILSLPIILKILKKIYQCK